MLVSYLESFKYVGHLFPLAFLRVYMGFYFLQEALNRLHGRFLTHPQLAELIREWSSASPAPEWYKDILDAWVLPQWQLAAYSVVYFQFVLGISFILGFFVRPVAVLGALLAMNFIFWSSPQVAELYRMQVIVLLIIAWMGAGRCAGMDYYFYKRHRGIWW